MVKSSASPQSSRKIMSTVKDPHTKIVRPVECFTLKGSSEFASRSGNIFNSLSNLENKHQTWVADNETHESFEDRTIPEPVAVQAAPDIFKKPFAPPLKRKVPSKRNTKKWIKYSLEDIPLTSDAANSAVAFKFLRELREKKEKTEDKDSGNEVIFCRPIKGKRDPRPCGDDTSSSSVSSTQETTSDHVSSSTVKEFIEKRTGVHIKLLHLDDDFDDA